MTVPPSSQTFVSVIESKLTPEKPIMNSISPITAWLSSNFRAIAGELVATMLLIIFGCMSCIPLLGFDQQPPLYAPLGFGLAVLITIQIFGHVSGAHMNPAVTLGAVIWGSISIPLAVAYAIMQCAGSIMGYAILTALSPVNMAENAVCITANHPALTAVQAMGVEIVLTATLLFICCGLWDPVNEHKQDSAPLKFGLAIAGLSLAGGPLTGAGLNPARSLGPALLTGIWDNHWVYWVGPIVGGVLGTTLYKYMFLKPKL